MTAGMWCRAGGPENWAEEVVSGQQKCMRDVSGGREESRLPTSHRDTPQLMR